LSEPIVIRVFFKDKLIAVKQFEQDQIIIGKIGFGDINCFYTVFAERKDIGKLVCEI
jgi:hypothetical protein